MATVIRFYVCDIIGTGTDADPFRPALHGVVDYGADDGRLDRTQAGGWMIVWCDVTDAEHATLITDSRVRWIPFEDSLGAPLGPDALIGELSVARRSAIRTALENHHIPTNDLTLTDPLRKVVARIVRRIRIRRALRDADWFEGLDTLISDIPANRRNTIRNRLDAAGRRSVVCG